MLYPFYASKAYMNMNVRVTVLVERKKNTFSGYCIELVMMGNTFHVQMLSTKVSICEHYVQFWFIKLCFDKEFYCGPWISIVHQ